MAIYLTVDGGTTNTRIFFIKEGRAVDVQKISAGARDGADVLKNELRQGILELLARNGCKEAQVTKVLASGMITSEYGLCNLPHITLPAGIAELRQNLYETVIPEVTAIPFCFVRGVRSAGETLAAVDMMRGEETELMGLMDVSYKDALYILPGSHSKHIATDSAGRITSFRTMLSGELLAAVAEHTILRDAADLHHNTLIEADLQNGYLYAAEYGLNEALFKTRVLCHVFGGSKETCYSFLLGAILCGEVRAIVQAPQTTVVIGGQKQLRAALAALLRTNSRKTVRVLDDETVETSTALGAVRIYEHS